MNFHEYQAKQLFAEHGVPVTLGVVATTPQEAEAGAAELGGRVVVKAQVKAGGRGKAGGVKLADGPADARDRAEDILGMDIKGHTVGTVMIAQGAQIAEEYYFSILLDRANRTYLAMCSKEGGMDIEQLAVERPEALARIEVDPIGGIDEAKATEIARAGGFPDELIEKVDAEHPGIRGRVLDDDGKLRRFVNVYVGEEDVRFAGGLETPTPDGVTVSIIPAVAGG